MPCLRTPSTSSIPNAFDPTQLSSLKYSGVYSQLVVPCTPAFTIVPCALSNRTPTSSVSRLEMVSYTTSMPPGNAIGSPVCDDSTPPDHAAAASITASAGSCGDTSCAPSLRASSSCAPNLATTPTSTSGYNARRIATAHDPSAPAPYTSTLPPGAGGCRVTACNDTANGSANTATSSGTSSGTRN